MHFTHTFYCFIHSIPSKEITTLFHFQSEIKLVLLIQPTALIYKISNIIYVDSWWFIIKYPTLSMLILDDLLVYWCLQLFAFNGITKHYFRKNNQIPFLLVCKIVIVNLVPFWLIVSLFLKSMNSFADILQHQKHKKTPTVFSAYKL